MAAPQLFTIERPDPGWLSTMAAPPGEQLSLFIGTLKEHGVRVLVSLLPLREEARLGLDTESRLATEAEIEFLRLPTRDFRAPQLDATRAMAAELADRLALNLHVVIHCRGGVGRSSTLAAAVLVHEGMSPDEAWRRIAAARGAPVPETRGQQKVVDRLSAEA